MDRRRWPQRPGIKVAVLCGTVFIICLLRFHVILSSRLHTFPVPACDFRLFSDNISVGMNERRSELYKRLESQLDNDNPPFLNGGETSQSLKVTDLFKIVGNKIDPIHKPASPPVRANVLYLHRDYASKISKVVEATLAPHFSNGVWYQNPKVYHFSLFHASHHIEPVPASVTEVRAEYTVVEQVAKSCYPIHIVLEKVVLTSSGVLMGCWQVENGTEPAIIRERLRHALIRAPKTQLSAPEMLHSSFARIIGPPDLPDQETTNKHAALTLIKSLVLHLNNELRGFQADIRDLWYVEELDILALALNGRTHVKKFGLGCSPSLC